MKRKELTMKEVTKKIILVYTLPQFAVGLFTTMLNNYLIYFYQPTEKSGLPTLITQGTVVLGILTVIGFIKAVGHVIDATVDPLIADLSDKSKHKDGRRIPFMRWFAIPYALSSLLIFCAPANEPGAVNNLWLTIFLWAYYVFYSLYLIPHHALLPEMIQSAERRVNVYTMDSLFFVVGSMVGYATTAFVDIFKSAGLAPVSAWRLVFGIFTAVGIVLLLLPTFFIKEKEYVQSVQPKMPLLPSIKHAFKNKNFTILTVAQLLEGTGMSIFQACIMYYITELLNVPESQSIIIMASSIVGSLVLYPFVNKWAKNKGKKIPMIAGCTVFALSCFVICFVDMLPGENMVKGIVFALVVSFPFAVLNILPGSMMSDVIQHNTLTTSMNQEGIFSAAKSFVTQMGTSLSIMLVPSLTVIGAAEGANIGKKGLMLTGIVGGVFCLLSVLVFAFYKEKQLLNEIRELKK